MDTNQLAIETKEERKKREKKEYMKAWREANKLKILEKKAAAKKKEFYIVYHNKLNKMRFPENMNKNELIIFWLILGKLKDKQNREVKFEFLELRKILKWGKNDGVGFEETLDSLIKKLNEVQFKTETETETFKETISMGMFSLFAIGKDKENGTLHLRLRINPDSVDIVNNLRTKGNFTMFRQSEMVTMKSKYTALFFPLMQEKINPKILQSRRELELSREEFMVLMQCENYKDNQWNMDKKVIDVIIQELSAYDIKLTKVKNGNYLKTFIFNFKNENINEVFTPPSYEEIMGDVEYAPLRDVTDSAGEYITNTNPEKPVSEDEYINEYLKKYDKESE